MQPPSPSRTRALLAALTLTVLGAWGCSLVESAQADKMLAATLLTSPPVDLKFLLPDASYAIPFDAGSPFHLPDGGLPFTTVVPGQTTAQIFFGQRAADYTSQPTGIAGAKVTLSIGDKSFTLKDQGGGSYGLSSQEDATLLYQDDAKVDLSIVSGGTTYTASVVAPGKDDIAQFQAVEPWPLDHVADTKLDLTRSNTENVAFTTVIPVTQQGQGQISYTDIPVTALDLLDLIANDALWKRKVIPIPATAFPEAKSYYAVTVAAVKRGDTSTNLFTASAFLVGKADVGVVKTK